MLVLLFLLFLSFVFSRFLLFYISFELGLIPLLFIIAGWGYQVERIQAAFYICLYTVFGSLPLLFFILYLQNNIVWLLFFWIKIFERKILESLLVLVVFFGFFVKLPTYFLHLWLPKAHVEAPVIGSILLAAVLLKIRFYGVYRALPFIMGGTSMWGVALLVFVLWGSIVASFVALIQQDIKSLVAFSSIRHMGVLMCGVLIFFSFSVEGRVILALSHGFSSSALFFLVNIAYEQQFTRQTVLIISHNNQRFLMLVWWFLFVCVNFSLPPFIRFLGELFVFLGIYFYREYLLVVLIVIVFVVAGFSVFVFSVLSLGKQLKRYSAYFILDSYFIFLTYHFIPLLLTVFVLDFFLL